MGILTCAVIFFGTTIISGLIIKGKNEEAKAQIQQLESINEQLGDMKNYVDGLKTQLIKSKEHLYDGKKNFKNGGHVLNGEPLANTEFNSCINDLELAITSAGNLISDFDETIEANEAEIVKLRETIK